MVEADRIRRGSAFGGLLKVASETGSAGSSSTRLGTPQATAPAAPGAALESYLGGWAAYRSRLAALYEGQPLARKKAARGGGWTWGYVLTGSEGSTTGSSIGEDEIRLFYDLCLLSAPSTAYVIGHAFGLSTFALALAAGPGCRVFGIDNWQEGANPHGARRLSERLIGDHAELANVRLSSGTSPADTPRALAQLDGPLSLLFIDAEHTDAAALADFEGCLPFLTDASLCLWHNVDQTLGAFDRAWERAAVLGFDRRYVLRSYGPTGVFFSSRRHPLLDPYLAAGGLVWHDWQTFLPVIRRVRRCRTLLERDRRPTARLERRLRRLAARWLRRPGSRAARPGS